MSVSKVSLFAFGLAAAAGLVLGLRMPTGYELRSPAKGGGSIAGGVSATRASGDSKQCMDTYPQPSGITWGGRTRFMYGVNYAWEIYGGDFGGISRWNQAGVAGNVGAVSSRLGDMAAHGVDVVRWWVWPDFRGNGVQFDGS